MSFNHGVSRASRGGGLARDLSQESIADSAGGGMGRRGGEVGDGALVALVSRGGTAAKGTKVSLVRCRGEGHTSSDRPIGGSLVEEIESIMGPIDVLAHDCLGL